MNYSRRWTIFLLLFFFCGGSICVPAIFAQSPADSISVAPSRRDLTVETPAYNAPVYRWYTLPVGHGDAHVLVDSRQRVAVVDAGATETVGVLLTFLHRLEADTIHTLILTHPHWDHIGGALELLDKFNIREVWKPELGHRTRLNQRLSQKLSGAEVTVRDFYRGDTSEILPGLPARIINPPSGSRGNLNKNSTAFWISVNSTNLLFLGDVIGPAETELVRNGLVPPRAEIVKAPHHGDSKGLSEKLLKAVQPSAVLIPAPRRENDPWGYPEPGLFDRLRAYKIDYFHTGRDGLIEVMFSPNNSASNYRIRTYPNFPSVSPER